MAGMVPIVNLENQLAIIKEPLDPSIIKSGLSDSISLMGDARVKHIYNIYTIYFEPTC